MRKPKRPPKSEKFLTLKNYARHREVSPTAIQKAIKSGRLKGAATKLANGHWKIDSDLADQLLSGRTNPTKKRSKESSGKGRRPRPSSPRQKALFEDLEGAGEPDLKPEIDPETGLELGKGHGPQAADYQLAHARKTEFEARLRELDYKTKVGELCENKKVEKEAFRIGRQLRDALLRIPERESALLAAESNEHTIKERLIKELTSAMEVLFK